MLSENNKVLQFFVNKPDEQYWKKGSTPGELQRTQISEQTGSLCRTQRMIDSAGIRNAII